MNEIYLSLNLLISTLCDRHMETQKKECIEYFNKCYNESMKKEWAQKYTIEYRRVIVFQSCGQMGGYIKL